MFKRLLLIGTLLAFYGFSGLKASHGDHDHPSKPPASVQSIDHHDARIKFVKNEGQWDSPILYRADIPSGRFWLEANTLTYAIGDMSNAHDTYFHCPTERDYANLSLNAHAFRLHFPGGNAQAVEDMDPYAAYHNYFIGDDKNRWRGGVSLFRKLMYKGLWPGVDMIFYGREHSIKYDYVVAAGSDPAQISMKYEGLDGIELKNGSLLLKTSIYNISEQKPYAYQDINGERVEVACNFVLNGETVSFEFPNGYDQAQPLVIDPTWIFGSYTGSTSDNFGYTATYDLQGNLYAGGIAFGLGYPLTIGAYQVNFGGGGVGGAFSPIDISISKFNPGGTALVYSTFLGGSNNEQPHSLITNANGELHVYGRTYSTDYPVSTGAYQGTNAGQADIVVTKFNAAGSNIIGSTYVGGTADDGMNITTAFSANSLKFNYGDDARGEIMLDDLGNVYVASCTQSNDFPTVTPFQPIYGGGLQDGVVFKMTPNLGAMTWSSYLGGIGNDAAYSVKVDTGRVSYVCGGTASSDFPTTPNMYQNTYNGGIDGFVCKINPAGNSLLASTFVGTNSYDQSYFIEIGRDQGVYLYGQTLGAFPVTPGKYTNLGGKQFIIKLDNSLASRDWSTVFGSGGFNIDISPTAFLVDICDYIYVAGWGGTTNFQGSVVGMPTTPNAIFPVAPDGSDIYLMVLEKDGVALEYGTFYGGSTSAEHVDGGTSRFNKNLEVYHGVCAGCGGNSDFPTTLNAVSSTNNSTNCNMGVFKIAFDPQSIIAAYSSQVFDSCAPFPVSFTNNSTGGVSFIWDFGDGSPVVTSFNASHTYVNPGTYSVKLTVIDSNSCNVADSIIQTVTVFPNPVSAVTGGGNICSGNSVNLQASGGQFYNWSPPGGLSSTTGALVSASPAQTTTYQVIVSDTNGCVDTNQVTVNVTDFAAEAGLPAAFCAGTGGAQLQAGTPQGGVAPFYYTWWCDSTNTFCGLDSIYDDDPIANPTVTTTYYLQVTDFTGCVSSIDSVVVTVHPIPEANAGPDVFLCENPAPGDFLQGSIGNSGGPFSYYWTPGKGLNDSTILTPYARPDTTTIYTLVAIDLVTGCTSERNTVDTLSTVTVHVNPRPTAEAGPDRDICFGDTVMLQGFGFGAGPGYRYEWSPSNSLSDSTQPNPIGDPNLTTDYILVVWSNGCPSYGDTVTINVHTLPTPDAGPDRDICLGEGALLDGSASGDSTATSYSYVWSPSVTLDNATLEDPTATPDSSQWYYVQATSNYGCESPPDSVWVRVKPTPQAEAGPLQTICPGDTATLFGSYFYTTTDSANPSQVYYSWIPAANIDDSTQAQPTAWPGTSQYYYLRVSHNTCSSLDSVLVNVFPEIGAQAFIDTAVACQGDSVLLTGIGGQGQASFDWMPSASLSSSGGDSVWAAPDSSTTFVLVVTEGFCSDTAEVNLEVLPTPEMEYLSSLTSGCFDFEVNFLSTADQSIFHVWDFGDGSPVSNELNPIHTYTQPGTYNVSLVGVSMGGCKDMVTGLTISVGDTAAADFVTDPDVPVEMTLPGAEVQFTDRSRNAISWKWDFGDGASSAEKNPVHVYNKAGEYYPILTVSTAEGCFSKVQRGPIVITAPDLFIPNVFTPNEDDRNDGFAVNYTGSQPFNMEIFDRWGVFLFGSRDKLEPWDGRDPTGQPMPEGVYFYTVKIGDQSYTGAVSLFR